MSTKPRRSVLFMPANNARALEKAKTIAADSLVFDLEDAVQPEAKELARDQACTAARSGDYGTKEIMIRCNGLDSAWWQDDVIAIAKSDADGLVVPKLSTVDDLKAVYGLLATHGAPEMPVWAMIETPLAVLNAAAIASVGGSLAGFMMGANDLTLELRAKRIKGRAPIMTALSMTVLAARANGLAVLDAVYNDFRDTAGFEEECQQALEMGFDGKTLIHPSQVDIANTVFSPSAEEIAQAKALKTAYEAALAEGKGVATHNGKMIEELHVREAERVLGFNP